jgi:hypothetical protein
MTLKLRTPSANTPTVAVEQMVALSETLELLDVDPALLEQARDALVEVIDKLPIDHRGTIPHEKRPYVFFVLVGGQWWPCHSGEIVTDEDDPLFGALRWKAHMANGELSQGIAMLHQWAKAAPDGSVDYHWLHV